MLEIWEDEENHVILIPFDMSEDINPSAESLAVHLEIAANGFTGRGREVWFWRADLRDFVRDLERLERQRSGEATLRSMSPDECALSIQIADRAGHVVVGASLQLPVLGVYPDGAPYHHKIQAGFGLDPAALPGIVRDFQELLTYQRPPTQVGQ